MNGFDLSTASDIVYNGSTVTAVYCGSTLIWPPQQHDYSQDYFTIRSLANNNTITFSDWLQSTSSHYTIYVSNDDGLTWSSYTSSFYNTTIATLDAGEKILIKGNNSHYGTTNTTMTKDFSFFQSTDNCEVEGNIMSLVYGDNFIGQTTLIDDYTFTELFDLLLVNAENLVLPATTIAPHCYYALFRNRTRLLKAPKILPATTLALQCYGNMFYGCTVLTTAPTLPATTLAQGCYVSMFSWCESLTTAPTLPATTLLNQSYDSMFYNCYALNSVTCLATDISASNCTQLWLQGVSSTGTFTKNSAMSSWPTGVSGIPLHWTVQDY